MLEIDVGGLLDVAALHHLADRQPEGARELPVALVVPGHGHDGAGAVAHQHVVGDPDRQLLTVDGVHGMPAGGHARLLPLLLALQIALARGLLAVGVHRRALCRDGDGVDQRVLGGQHHVGGAEQRVRPSGEDAQAAARAIEREVDLGPDRAADPIALHLERARRPVHQRQVVEQPLGVGGDLEHPLAHRLANDVVAADLALAVDDLFVGENRAQLGAPVDRHVRHVRQPALVQLEEDPLRPAVVAGIGGVDLAIPVVRQPGALHLPAEGGDVLARRDSGVDARLARVFLGRQSERVPAGAVQDVEPPHALVPAQHVGRGVALEVPHVQPRAGRVGEEVDAVVLGRGRAIVGTERLVLVPVPLPARLDFAEGIAVHRRVLGDSSERRRIAGCRCDVTPRPGRLAASRTTAPRSASAAGAPRATPVG